MPRKKIGWKSGASWPTAGPKPWSTSVGVAKNVWRKPKAKGFRSRRR